MDDLVVAVVGVAMAISALLNLGHQGLAFMDGMYASWGEMEALSGQMARTKLSLVSDATQEQGADVLITLKNQGETALADFSSWDVIIQYYKVGGQPNYLITRLTYTAQSPPGANQWTVSGIFLNASAGVPEVFEPGVVNPQEEVVIRIKLNPRLRANKTHLVSIVASNGVYVPVMVAA